MKNGKERPEDVRADVLDLIETRGIRAAAQAAIDVCEDKTAPAPARATASTTLFRVAKLGGFGKDLDRDRTKELHEMDGYELQAALEDLTRQRAARERRARQGDAGGAEDSEDLGDAGVFD